MDTLDKLLDLLAERTGLSDRQISAQLFGLSFGAVTHWRTGRAFPDDDQSRRLAELLELEPAYVAAIVRAARAKNKDTRAMWQRVADAFGKAAMLAIVAAAPFMAPPPAEARLNNNASFLSLNGNTHCLRKRRRRSAFAAAVAALLSLSGCSGMLIDSHTAPPAGWPALHVIEHRVERTAMEARCGRWVPWYSTVFACAEWHFAAGECHVWITPDTSRFVIEHELMHCRGHDHPGATTARDAWHAYSAAIAARALAVQASGNLPRR